MATSLVDHIQERYLDDDDGGEDVLIQSFLCSSPNKMRGGSLQLVVLNHRGIDHVGDIGVIASLVRSVTEVDLAWNRISKWTEVGTMLKHLSHLRTFNISHNTLPDDLEDESIPICSNMETLILNGTNLPLPTIRKFARKMPGLREMHLSQNKFDEAYFDALSQPGPSNEDKENGVISETTSHLHLNCSNISRWSDAEYLLSHFPKCETVFLCENPLREIKSNSQGKEKSDILPISTLRMVSLSKTDITDWSSVEAIDSWPHLVDLRISNIPLLEEYTEEEKLHLVVGRLRGLKVLNGSSISEEQRETSERFFVRYYEDRNPRPRVYDALLAKHGKLEKLVKLDLTPQMHVRVKVFCEENGLEKEMSMRLTWTIAQLMRQLEKVLAIPHDRMRLFHHEPGNLEGGYGPVELRYGNQALHSVRIEDGSRIEVQSKIVRSRKRTQTKSTSSSN